MNEQISGLGFADAHDCPVPYMDRLRSYYLALGYGNPYKWAHYADTPFTPLEKPLAEARIALVTTAAPYQPDQGDQGPGAPYNAGAKFYNVYSDRADGAPDLRISHLGYDRKYSTADDINSYFPLAQLKTLASEGRIKDVAPRFHGAPTNRSQAATIDKDCPDILDRIREDGADAAIIVAN